MHSITRRCAGISPPTPAGRTLWSTRSSEWRRAAAGSAKPGWSRASALAQGCSLVLRRALHPLAQHDLESREGDQTDRRAGDMEQPEGSRRQARIKAADIADDLVRGEERQIIEPDHSRGDLL